MIAWVVLFTVIIGFILATRANLNPAQVILGLPVLGFCGFILFCALGVI